MIIEVTMDSFHPKVLTIQSFKVLMALPSPPLPWLRDRKHLATTGISGTWQPACFLQPFTASYDHVTEICDISPQNSNQSHFFWQKKCPKVNKGFAKQLWYLLNKCGKKIVKLELIVMTYNCNRQAPLRSYIKNYLYGVSEDLSNASGWLDVLKQRQHQIRVPMYDGPLGE